MRLITAEDPHVKQQQGEFAPTNLAFLTIKDLQVVERARCSGDLKALKQHIAVLEKALPSLRPSREHQADLTALKRLPYLQQVLPPLLFVISRVHLGQFSHPPAAPHQQHAW